MRYLPFIQIVVSVLLVAAILLQRQGTGLSGIFGGEGNAYRTKRGFEKILFVSTIVLAILFVALGIATVIIQ